MKLFCKNYCDKAMIVKRQLKKIIPLRQWEKFKRAVVYLKHPHKFFNTYRYQIRDIFLSYRNSGGRDVLHGKISIVIPTLSKSRHADHLPKLKKLLSEYLPNQEYGNYEALVYCDGPNKIVENMVASLNDPRIKVYFTDTTLGKWGHPQTRMGIKAATGDFFVRMNDDNKPYKNYLRTLIKGFDQEVGVVYGRVVYGGDARMAHWSSLVHSFVIPGDKQGILRIKNIDCMNYMVKMDLAKKYVEAWRDAFSADWFFLENLFKNGIRAKFSDVIIGEKL